MVSNSVVPSGDMQYLQVEVVVNEDVNHVPEQRVVQRLGIEAGEDVDRVQAVSKNGNFCIRSSAPRGMAEGGDEAEEFKGENLVCLPWCP